jgi:hypothetical protein
MPLTALTRRRRRSGRRRRQARRVAERHSDVTVAREGSADEAGTPQRRMSQAKASGKAS